jgi:hypothetical protein
MAGKSPVWATPEQVRLLEAKAGGSDRAEADRARSILLTLRGWTSSRLSEAFCPLVAKPIHERRR